MMNPRLSHLTIITLVLAVGCGGSAATSTGALGTVPSQADEGALMVGGQPSVDELEEVIGVGRSLVISLRTEGESGQEGEEATVTGAGARFVRIPVAGASGLTEENVARLHQVMSEASPGETVLHCGSGNRAGAMLALRAYMHLGATPDEALALGEAAGLSRLREAVEQRMRDWTPAAE